MTGRRGAYARRGLTGGLDVELQCLHKELVQTGENVNDTPRVHDADKGNRDVRHGRHAE